MNNAKIVGKTDKAVASLGTYKENMEFNQIYPAKILLFGEHSVLKGGSALAIPTLRFSGKWELSKNDLHDDLVRFLEYLVQLNKDEKLLANLDLVAFQQMLEQGLSFESNIPFGYGLGSSGALVAAIYDVFAKQKITDLVKLKLTFAQLESYFHGTSSGLDPLICYLNKAVLLKEQSIKTENIPPTKSHLGELFLLDTQKSRQTGTLVNWFLAQCEQKAFLEKIQQLLLPTVDIAITAWLQGEFEQLFDAFEQISVFQLEYFQPMIPSDVRPIWEAMLSREEHRLKLCGAGGGGFFLGITRNIENLVQKYPNQVIRLNVEKPH